jgi:hypothetical protein
MELNSWELFINKRSRSGLEPELLKRVSRTAAPVHVNIWPTRYCVSPMLVYCFGWRDTTDSTTSPPGLSANYSVVKMRLRLLLPAEGTPLAECSFDSDWILRTLSPSNESSKDLNLQRINMNLLYHGGQQHSAAHLYKSGQNPVIVVVIRISYVNQLDRLSQW